ncbi:hypothetical protein FDZ71_18270 [bacterium]|nr:MAG: hypothetical protein FDZ71_18270 [bacterium]
MGKISALTLLLAAILLFRGYSLWNYSQSPNIGDFYTYWAGAKYAKEHPSPFIYDEEAKEDVSRWCSGPESGFDEELRQKSEGFYFYNTQSPLAYALLSSLSSGNYWQDLSTFKAASFLSVAAALILSLWFFGFGINASLIMLNFIIYLYDPLRSDIGTGNAACLELGLLTLSILPLASGKKFSYALSGFMLAFLLLLKANIAFAPLFWLASMAVTGRKRELKETMAGGALGAALGLLWGGSFFGEASIWIDWAKRIIS